MTKITIKSKSLYRNIIKMIFGLSVLMGSSLNTAISEPDADGTKSINTTLSGKKCKLVKQVKASKSSDTVLYTQLKCPGVGGYRLYLNDDDSRQSITVQTPTGQRFDQNYWGIVAKGFTHTGKYAEWRTKKIGRKIVPHALIVRVFEQISEQPVKHRSWLVVSHIKKNIICVVKRISESKMDITNARAIADKSVHMKCIK